MSTTPQFHRHGSYYTPINSDCVEFCPHPKQQQYLFTGHYELLSKEQGKFGQICLSEVVFDSKLKSDQLSESTTFIPQNEYCTATNENQDVYMTREVDFTGVLQTPLPTFGQCLKTTNEDDKNHGDVKTDQPDQTFIHTNSKLIVHDQINIPALLDAKWSYQPIPIYSITNSQQPIAFSSLLAGALEDGSVRLYSTTSDQKIQPQSAVQISTEGICLYIDWSNKHRYSPIKALFSECLPYETQAEFPGEDDLATFFTKPNNYFKFWQHYDQQLYQQTQYDVSKLFITPHYCNSTTNTSSSSPTPSKDDETIKNGSNIGDFDDGDAIDDDYYEHEEGIQSEYYLKGKQFYDNFFTCSLSDGTVAIVDVKSNHNTPSNDTTTKGNNDDNTNTQNQFSLSLTHHWKAHQAECWVAACDGFNPNIIYTGADDTLMKMWDLRLINTVNQQMDMLELNTNLKAENQLQIKSYKSLQDTTCTNCGTTNLSLHKSPSSSTHGVGFDISQCTALRGNQIQCTASNCYCNANNNSSTTPTTQQYKFNIDKLVSNSKFNTDFTPVDDAYPLLINTQHQAGVIEIKPHPYNPFLLLTGSYDNHVTLYDKRNLRKPISRVDTGGGAWRIKWHTNPIYSNQFLLVNMYNGVQLGTISGMQIDLSTTNHNQTASTFKQLHYDQYNTYDLFQPIQNTSSTSFYPSLTTSKPIPVHQQPQESFQNFYQTDQMMKLDPTNQHFDTESMNTSPYRGYIEEIYNFGNDQQHTNDLEVTFESTIYEQHGPKSIVYGGDWCLLNNISNVSQPVTNNIAVTCSFYNKRTDLLHFE